MRRILVADDHPENREFMRALLEGNGFAMDEVGTGEEALVAARQLPVNAIVSDLMMPGMDGYTLLRHWKADDDLARVPFIVYTATFTEPRDERLALALGADAFIVKPAEPDALLAGILDVLARIERGEKPNAQGSSSEDTALLHAHNEVLLRKYESKARQLERTNRELLEEIAERRRTEEALRASDERFRATFELAAVGIAHVGIDGAILRVNDRLCEMTGRSREDLLGAQYAELILPEDLPDAEAARRAMLARSRATNSVDRRCRRKDGSTFWANVVTTLPWDDAGQPTYFISVLVDISDRKELEGQLLQAQKIEAVGLLAGGVAHDFNNLLTVITGYCQLMLHEPQASDLQREATHAIIDAGRRAAALTGQLLGFSRRAILQPEVLDLNAVVEETSSMLRRLITEDIELSTLLAPGLWRVKVDAGQLDQVLMNLAVNARDAMPGGGRLTIETANVVLGEGGAATHADCKPGRHVKLAMTDTGCGMTPDVMARMFEPFYTTKEVGKGTGLGLSMVFGIVRQSEGCIHVESEPGRGTRFEIYLPAMAEQPAQDAGPRPRTDFSGNETILLVEDDEAVRRLAMTSLQRCGYAVLPATDGNDAMRIALEHAGEIAIALTDVVMPHLGGPELAERLRARFPGIKVLFTSGYTDDAVMRRGVMKADVWFLQKPYTPQSLAAKVREVLDSGASTGPS